MNIIVKNEFLQTVVAFGNSGLPLGQRDDLIDLAIIAQESNDLTLLQLFEKLPSLATLKKAKTDKELKAVLPEVVEGQQTTQEMIDAAVPEDFNKNTKLEELNKKAPTPSK